MNRKTICAVAGISVLFASIAATSVRAEMTVVEAFMDATIFEEDNLGANGAGENLFVGVNNDGDIRRALVRFAIDEIPNLATVDSVKLELDMDQSLAGDVCMTIHRATTPWTEGSSEGEGNGGGQPSSPATFGDATWQFGIVDTDPWTQRGGDFTGDGTAITVGGTGTYTWKASAGEEMADVVASWVLDPSQNFGWVLKACDGEENTPGTRSAKRFGSKEQLLEADRPTLTVYWRPPTPTESGSWGQVKARYRDR